MKSVRVTLELPLSAVALLIAKAELSRWTEHLPSSAAEGPPPTLDIASLLAWLVCLEARGATEAWVHMSTPMEWRDDKSPTVIHRERRVYEDGEMVSGPAEVKRGNPKTRKAKH